MPYPASDINNTASSTHDQRPGPHFSYAKIISDAIMTAIWNGDMGYWKASERWAGDRGLDRKFTPVEIYNWVNTHKAEINETTTNPYHHNWYLRGRKTPGQTKDYIKLLTDWPKKSIGQLPGRVY
jgi:hypothetical protein